MRRRDFLHAVGGVAAGWSLSAQAQQAPNVHHIGILVQTQEGREHLVEAFKQGLRELGYVEGQNIDFQIRSADGYYDRLEKLATELANLHVAVIFADTT